MDKEIDFDLIVRRIAKEHGVTPKKIKQNMQEALDAGRNNLNPAVQAMWRSIPCKGEVPTINEVLVFLTGKVAEQYHN